MTTATIPSKPPTFVDPQRFLDCVHCGLCLSACPTYLETGKEMDSPRGRIYLLKSLQSGRLPLADSVVKHIDLCLGCRACEVACPSGVHYGELLEHGRDFIERNHKRGFFQSYLRRMFIEGIFPYPTRLEFLLMPVRILQAFQIDRLLARIPWFRSLSFLPNLSRIASRPLPTTTLPQGTKRLRVGMISGCVMSVLFTKTNEATIRLLARAGCEVVVPRNQACCGALFVHGGSIEKAKKFARRNIDVFEKLDLDFIIINAAGCGSTLKEYGKLLRDDPNYAERAAAFAVKVKDLSEFLAASDFESTSSRDGRVTFHDACHLAHAQGIKGPPRQLVRSVEGTNYVELCEADMCCGSAGSYNLTEPAMADRLQKRKVENLQKTGARIVVTTNPGCMLQIEAGLRKAGSDMKVMHLADYLDGERQS